MFVIAYEGVWVLMTRCGTLQMAVSHYDPQWEGACWYFCPMPTFILFSLVSACVDVQGVIGGIFSQAVVRPVKFRAFLAGMRITKQKPLKGNYRTFKHSITL